MKPHALFAALILAAASSAACSPGDRGPAGNPESRTYPLADFTNVSAETGIELILKQGAFAVEAQSHDADLSRLVIEKRGATLDIGSSQRITIGRSPTYTVTVTAPAYEAITASAGVKITGENLKFDNLKVDTSTGVAADLSGECIALDASASAGAVINARGLKCVSAKLDAAAGAKIEAFASEKADARAAAGAVIDIYGSPPNVSQNASVAGVINVH